MSQNYMDGVPVKISEKYKPPPPIAVPSGLFERLSTLSGSVRSANYDFTLETNVLRKLEEWRNARETIVNERNHRIQLKEEARQRELDQIAASETEEKLKQLSVSEVFYPNADEISEISPDDSESVVLEPQIGNADSSERSEEAPESVSIPPSVYTERNQFDDPYEILQPIPAPPNGMMARVNLLDDLDPLKKYQQSIKMKTNKFSRAGTFYNKSVVDKLSVSDFENDTSSPFDNVELKTINEWELLAQVLGNQSNLPANGRDVAEEPSANVRPFEGAIASESFDSTRTYSDPYSISSGGPVMFSPVASYDRTTPMNTSFVPAMPYSVPMKCVPMNSQYYNCNSDIPALQNEVSMSNVNDYYAPTYAYSMSNVTYQNPANMNRYEHLNNESAIYSETGQLDRSDIDSYSNSKLSTFDRSSNDPYNYYNVNYPYIPQSNCQAVVSSQPLEKDSKVTNMQSLARSRSRSVPDIVKELDDEVSEARLKSRERSHNCSPAPYRGTDADASSRPPVREKLPNRFDDLSPRLQLMCRNIVGMGFPLDRVARACVDIGDDDKKIIEYLLIMGQLMDLGFPESKVAAALVQNNCNRDRALDELIS